MEFLLKKTSYEMEAKKRDKPKTAAKNQAKLTGERNNPRRPSNHHTDSPCYYILYLFLSLSLYKATLFSQF